MAEAQPPTRLSLAQLKDLFLQAAQNFSADNVPRLAGAFSFYAVLSLAPLLVLAISVGGYFLGDAEARGTLLREAQGYLGKEASEFLAGLIETTYKPGATLTATLLSLVVTFFSASNLFLQLSETVNLIWGIKTDGPIWKTLIKGRLTAFVLTLVFGVIILGWLVLDSWVGWLSRQAGVFPLAQVVSFIVTLVFLTGLFILSFRALPRGKVHWRDTIVAAMTTALGVAISKFLLGAYFAWSGVAGAYGSAGALVVILLWIYYTSQIYFFGIELTYVYSQTYGSQRDRPAEA